MQRQASRRRTTPASVSGSAMFTTSSLNSRSSHTSHWSARTAGAPKITPDHPTNPSSITLPKIQQTIAFSSAGMEFPPNAQEVKLSFYRWHHSGSDAKRDGGRATVRAPNGGTISCVRIYSGGLNREYRFTRAGNAKVTRATKPPSLTSIWQTTKLWLWGSIHSLKALLNNSKCTPTGVEEWNYELFCSIQLHSKKYI